MTHKKTRPDAIMSELLFHTSFFLSVVQQFIITRKLGKLSVIVCSLHNTSRSIDAHPTLDPMGCWGIFHGQGCKSDRSPASNAQLKGE